MSNSVYVISISETDPTTGMYAVYDEDGETMVQVFLDRDDAECYNTHLEALGQELHVCEIPDNEAIYRLCDMMGYGFVTINKGEVVVPRMETLKADLFDRSEPS
ncbi:hypothetical protein [Synechococcus phage S-N03]|uniref:Uncharacterized protein n=1 Tax=Synechococcus phage S-N03 TaxID=2718943 RepID=A0A6G8R5U7_9CAUD|nr:hypothetical protein PQC09_gp144 [Synechococcus phage S-N03]QIN96779.1 hypothetical protein [Synechococcus phage S-N03]